MFNKGNKFSGKLAVSAPLFMALFVVSISPFIVKAASDEPDVTTRRATDISNDGATLNGSVDGNGLSTTIWFEYGDDRDMDETTDKESVGRNDEDFSIDISDLRSDTTYYFRAIARNSEGTVHGSIFSFQTDSDDYSNSNFYNNDSYYYSGSEAPTAITEGTARVSTNSAELHSLNLNSINSTLNSWFEWGPTPSLDNSTARISLGSLPSVRHVDTLSGLAPSTIYYFRAVAENSYFRNVGSTMSFVTAGSSVASYTNTVTYVPEPIVKYVPVPAPAPAATPNATQPPAVDTASNLGANVLAANYFLPQNLFGWLVLVVLVLLLMLEIRHLLRKNSGPKH